MKLPITGLLPSTLQESTKMAEKKYKGRKAYLNDFQKDENGEYAYQGNLYAWQGENSLLRKKLIHLWGIGILTVILLAAAAWIDAPGATGTFYVVIPVCAALVFGVSMLWGLGRLTSGGKVLRAYVYEATVGQLPIRAVLTMVSAGAAVLGELLFLTTNGIGEKTGKALIFLVMESAVFLLCWIFRQEILKMVWKKQ